MIIDVIEAFEYQIRLKNINLQVFIDTKLPEVIKSDQDKIKQILFNLV